MKRQQPASTEGTANNKTFRQEQRLIDAAKNGDEEALSELYQRHVKAIYHYIFARVSNVSVAEELTSDVFVRAIETLDQYERRKVPFLGWLYRIAHGKVVDHHRGMRFRANHLHIEDVVVATDDNTEKKVTDQLYQEFVLQHLHELNDAQQQVLVLRFLQGHSVRATAKLMEKSESAVRSLQFRAVQTLSELLQMDQGESQ